MKVLKRILKYFSWLLIFIVILLIAVYFFIQTDTFNKWALEFTIGKLNKSLELKDNKVDAESLDGNILKGIKLNNGSVIIKGDTLVKFSYLEVKYNLWALLDHRISVEYVDLSYPRVNLIGIKSKDGLIWNFTNLFNKSTTPDTLTSKFDWDVLVNNFKIDNGFIRIAAREPSDSVPFYKMQRQKLNQFDFNNLDITDLNLEMSGKYYKDSKNLSLVNLSFNTNSDFNLKKFAVNADVNHKDTTSDINYLEIITDRSNIKVDKIHLSSFDPLDSISYNNFAAKDFNAKININNFNFADLRFFIPTVDMLDSTVQVYLDTRGKYGDMNVNSLTVKLPNSNIHLKGNIKHLDNPDSMYFDVTADELKIFPPDIKTVLKINSIPDYSNLGMVEGNLYYKGRLDNFYSEYDLKTGAGYINGVTTLDLNHETYNGNITTHSLNLGKILKNNKLNSNINLAAKFDGMGFALNKMNSNITYSMNNSSIMGYNISSSAGDIKSSNNNLNLKVMANTSAGNASVTGRVNIANLKNPVYAVKGNVKGLDVSKFTKKAGDKSNLNASFDINGRGASLDNINGKYNFVIDNSTYAQYRIPATPLNISIINSSSNGSINIVTDMAEINAKGSFDIGTISNAVSYNIASFSNIINGKLNPDYVRAASVTPANINGKNITLNYELVLKDTAKLRQVTEPFGINFNGGLKGSINNSPAGFNSTVLLNVKNFKYRDTVIVLKNVNTDLSFKNSYSSSDASSLSPYSIVLNTTGELIKLDSTRIDSAHVNFEMDNSIADLKASAKIDTTAKGSVAGKFDLTGDKIIANIDSLYAKYQLHEVQNDNKWVFNYQPGQEVNFEQMGIKTGGLVVNVKGKYSFTGNSDVTAEASTTPIDAILSTINPVDPKTVIQTVKSPFEGAVTRLYVNYKGSMENPEITAELNTNMLQYDGDKIGTINAKVNYKDNMLTPNIVLANVNNAGTLKIDGNVPFQNPLAPQDSTVVTELTGPVGLRVTANNFELGNFAKLAPGIGDITGILKGEITANGTASNPDLKGNLSIDNGTYLLPLTGMDYGFNLNVSTANSKLVIDKLSMYNQDDDSRHFDIAGNIDFTGLKLNDIDLRGSGDMVFLDKSVDHNELGVYGYLWGGSGNPPFTIKGNFQKLDVTGQFLIKEATISSVPLKGSGYDATTDNFTYVNATDSAAITPDSTFLATPDEFARINPFERYKYRLTEKPSSTFDFLNLDLNVKTEQNLVISMDFNNITRDRLFGEIQADLNLKTENKQLNAYGNVEVVGDSYYRFYRDFKIKDSRITFNGPLSNPILDIKAVYEGTKSQQQLGTNASVPVQVELTVKGPVDTPQVQLNLLENGSQVSGSDAQSDAITFLLFGKYKSDLNTGERQAVASSVGSQVGSLYASSYISQALRGVLPFIVDAEFNYNQGSGDIAQSTDIAVTSQFGDATVKVGSRQINNSNYFEFTIDYPVNKMLRLNLPETLLLELAKEELSNSVLSSSDVHYSTGLKLIYKFKF